jgi:hypothetical protein
MNKQKKCRMKKGWLAIVVPYRKEETDLQATLDAAAESAGAGAVIYAVEDKDHTGPGHNRHRGIEAATDAEVIVTIDAHMRFRGDVLRRLALGVEGHGGLMVPFCHHNSTCSFVDAVKTGENYYAGARMVYRNQDGDRRVALCAKWARDTKAGPRGAVMGACYAFRRDWYMEIGQPMAMLAGWGCEEEALSIAAWMSGHTPEVFDGHVAHLYRAVAPWRQSQTQEERMAVRQNRMALIHAVVSDATARRELEQWTGGQHQEPSPECERFRLALLKQPRKWCDWRKAICEPDEIDGKQAGGRGTEGTERTEGTKGNVKVKQIQPHKIRTLNIRVPVAGIKCPHCGAVHGTLPITHTWPNGNHRVICPNCGNPFIWFVKV